MWHPLAGEFLLTYLHTTLLLLTQTEQVAQATSLENIEFYMLFDSDVPGNNQQV